MIVENEATDGGRGGEEGKKVNREKERKRKKGRGKED